MDLRRRRARWQSVMLLPLLLVTACNAFVGTDEDFTLPDGKGPTLDLLTPSRRLPASATNIAGHVEGFQDPLLQVRFDAPAADATAFRDAMLEDGGDACFDWKDADVEDWPPELPKGAECREDRTVSALPPISVTLEPRGARTRIYVVTFKT